MTDILEHFAKNNTWKSNYKVPGFDQVPFFFYMICN